MVCKVQGQEEKSLISIQHGGTEKVTITSGCVIKSNDTRLSISCIETGNDIMISVNLTRPGSSDSGTWNCSYGQLYDTVTFADFISK
ncbi:hypothetical protein CHS0354_028006 [Potamilus streckersoni]|nr:hypothetical protein CHS0354_028006 [Potamilus streckersoni]